MPWEINNKTQIISIAIKKTLFYVSKTNKHSQDARKMSAHCIQDSSSNSKNQASQKQDVHFGCHFYYYTITFIL